MSDIPFGERWRLWAARRAKPRRPSDLAVGERAKVTGIVQSVDELLTAPFTQRRVVAYRTHLFEKSAGAEENWNTRIRDHVATPFMLETEGGIVLVEPRHAIVAVASLNVDDAPTVNDYNPLLRAYVQPQAVRPSMWMGVSGGFRFFEAVVMPGDRVAVWGRVHEGRGVVPSGYRGVATIMKVIVGAAGDPCIVLPP